MTARRCRDRHQHRGPRRPDAPACAIRQGFLGIGAEDNTVVLFSDLMDTASLFVTANADTVYYLAVVDPTAGPTVVERPPYPGAPGAGGQTSV